MEDLQINNALDFLMFSYFKVTFSDAPGQILYAAVKRAYQDATMRAALVLKKKFDKDDKNKEKYEEEYKRCEKQREAIRFDLREKEIVNDVVDGVKTLKDVFSTDNTDAKAKFEEWHKKLCNDIMIKFNNSYSEKLKKECKSLWELEKNQKYFTYGNAQKLINMTMKNLYIITVVSGLYKNNEKAEKWFKEKSWIVENVKLYHIPMDSYIFKIADVKGTWSSMDEKEYNDKKDEIDEKITSLDDEGPRWIEAAKKEAKVDYENLSKKMKKILEPDSKNL